jgi:hypothetical protein
MLHARMTVEHRRKQLDLARCLNEVRLTVVAGHVIQGIIG